MSPPRESEDSNLHSKLVRVETQLEFYKEQRDKLEDEFCQYRRDTDEKFRSLEQQIDESIKSLKESLEELKEAKIGMKSWILGALAVLSLIWPLISHQILKFLGW